MYRRRRRRCGLPTYTERLEVRTLLAGSVPVLASLPDSGHTIYLDFDGHITSNTLWNSNYANGDVIRSESFDLDGAIAFSGAESETIEKIWAAVAEDFAPFGVNVTTIEPTVDALAKSGVDDESWGIRVVVGHTPDVIGSPGGVLGVAYLNSFNSPSDTPAFVSSANLDYFGYGFEKMAGTISHEVGHAMGLVHQGYTSFPYYPGHGSGDTAWGPIMGSTRNPVSQWSDGSYPDSTSSQDDLAVITSGRNGFGYRIDDHGNSTVDASDMIQITNGFSDNGVIERSTDQDFFRFTTSGGTVDIDATPNSIQPNLKIELSIYDRTGQLIATASPAGRLDASLQLSLVQGEYFLSVEGTGEAGVFTDYGSLGQYSVSVTTTPGNPEPPVPSWLQFSSGVATINGTELVDTAFISGSGSQLAFSLNGEQVVLPASEVKKVEFNGFAGADLFRNDTSIDSVARGGAGNDKLIGGTGNDLLMGGAGDDILRGRNGHDIIQGGKGNDRLRGDRGNDTLKGGPGDDILNPGTGTHQIVLGGRGFDTLKIFDDEDVVFSGIESLVYRK